ncbi:hypothetical protein [Alishewanella tabrizica]|uniref:Sel1 repeat family protein n=1 Tax=Alishewanella tabrizica TaxID=671278 RepID=A0ABQ2WHH3_9ALTE|nr:hypothetical protein [Alishewanella tabrizica]GGW55067.1 hypothetical protein GCM10008111_08880 [Alishewanella tabrizica]
MQATIKSFKLGWKLWLLPLALLLIVIILWLARADEDPSVNPIPHPTPPSQHDTSINIVPVAEQIAERKSLDYGEIVTDRQKPHSRLLSIVHRPKWTLESTLFEQLDSLILAAESGDNEAAYILGMNLRHCSFAPVDDAGLQERLKEAYQFNNYGAAVTAITARYEFCLGVDNVQRSQFYTYLALAASRGFVPAQEAIAMITPEQYMQAEGYDRLNRNEYLTQRSAFVKQQVEFLSSAAQHGSIKALIRLSQLHYAQTVGEDGRLQAYAFNQIILHLTDDNELYNRYSWFQEQAQSVFTQEEMADAIDKAEQWLKIITTNGTLYLETD